MDLRALITLSIRTNLWINWVLLCGLDDLEDARQFGELTELIGWGVEEVGERENGDKIENKPGLEVVAADVSSVADELLYLVVVGWEESKDDIEDEDQVNEAIDQLPHELIVIVEGGTQRGSHRRE